jgi:4-amino-4-deoxy-L-arabinose transferase-like glycosyltransferase
MEFLGDQGRDVYIIRDFLKNGNLFFIGPQTSIGNMYLGPWFYYFIAPSLLISNFNPVGPAVFIALVNIFTIFLVYFIGNKWFNRSTGLISAFLFAISPVAVKYSNFIWNPNIMPLFALLFIYFFFEAIFQHRYKFFIYASLSFIMVINSHYLGLALLPLPGLCWLYFLIKFIHAKSKYLKSFVTNSLLAGLIFLISLIPQILFDIKHQGQNIKALLTFFTQRETTVNIKPYKAIPQLPSIFTQINTDLISGRQIIPGIVISVIFILLIIFYLFRNKAKNKAILVVFGWYFFGLVSLALYKQHLYAHYFGFLFPAVFLLIGFLIHKYKIIGIPLFITITCISIINNPFTQKPNYQLNHAQNLGTAINNHLNSADGSYNISMLASYNDFRAQAPRYFVNQNQLLYMEEYSQAKTLFVIIDDPNKWPQNINSDIWEINVFKENSNYKVIEEFTSYDNTKIFKLSK